VECGAGTGCTSVTLVLYYDFKIDAVHNKVALVIGQDVAALVIGQDVRLVAWRS
jgi:hypothetical protein